MMVLSDVGPGALRSDGGDGQPTLTEGARQAPVACQLRPICFASPDDRGALDARCVQRLVTMGAMLASFAHEVRNPMATLRILAEGLAAEVDDGDPRREYVARMMAQIERIERLSAASLRLTRPEPPRRTARSPAGIAAAALDVVSARVRALGGALRIEIEPDLPAIVVDEAQIVQVLAGLLSNALDATRRPAGVLLRAASAPPGRVRFDVIDDGPGMTEATLARIFEPFFTTKPDGIGLGLPIVRQLAHESGCSLEVSSAPGHGSTFSVLCPIIP